MESVRTLLLLLLKFFPKLTRYNVKFDHITINRDYWSVNFILKPAVVVLAV